MILYFILTKKEPPLNVSMTPPLMYLCHTFAGWMADCTNEIIDFEMGLIRKRACMCKTNNLHHAIIWDLLGDIWSIIGVNRLSSLEAQGLFMPEYTFAALRVTATRAKSNFLYSKELCWDSENQVRHSGGSTSKPECLCIWILSNPNLGGYVMLTGFSDTGK